jgi:hypothetical protein
MKTFLEDFQGGSLTSENASMIVAQAKKICQHITVEYTDREIRGLSQNIYSSWVKPHVKIYDDWQGGTKEGKKPISPQTIGNYLRSFRQLLLFRGCFLEELEDGAVTRVNTEIQKWCKSLTKKDLVRKEEWRKYKMEHVITPDMVRAYMQSSNVQAAIRILGQAPNRSTTDPCQHARARNFMLMMFAVCNGPRSGSVKNITLKHYREAANVISRGNNIFSVSNFIYILFGISLIYLLIGKTWQHLRFGKCYEGKFNICVGTMTIFMLCHPLPLIFFTFASLKTPFSQLRPSRHATHRISVPPTKMWALC